MSGMGDGIVETIGDAAPDQIIDGMPKDFKFPSKEEILAMLETMNLPEDQAEEIRAALMSDAPLGGAFGAPLPVQSSWTSESLILVSFFIFVASVFAFIFYRIYKAMNEKEVKREEKRQQKMLKKKKK